MSEINKIEAVIGKDFPKKVIPLIDAAKQSIKIVVFDWRWYPSDPGNPVQLFNQSIVRAVRRGVQVEAIANNDDIVKTLNGVGCKAKKLITSKLVHVKMILIDGEIVIIGSHNYTQSAFTMNHELSAILSDTLAAGPFVQFFNDLAQAYG
jgi:phosphatidylserine/phosphatidylglycerophosphate/cardiolipin synthase-like enzyme